MVLDMTMRSTFRWCLIWSAVPLNLAIWSLLVWNGIMWTTTTCKKKINKNKTPNKTKMLHASVEIWHTFPFFPLLRKSCYVKINKLMFIPTRRIQFVRFPPPKKKIKMQTKVKAQNNNNYFNKTWTSLKFHFRWNSLLYRVKLKGKKHSTKLSAT